VSTADAELTIYCNRDQDVRVESEFYEGSGGHNLGIFFEGSTIRLVMPTALVCQRIAGACAEHALKLLAREAEKLPPMPDYGPPELGTEDDAP